MPFHLPDSCLFPSDPEPNEAQAGEEEAAAAGGEAGHAGCAAEGARAAQSSHGVRPGHWAAGALQVPRPSGASVTDRQQDGAGGVTQGCDLQDPAAASPCLVKPWDVAGVSGWMENCFSCPNLPFLYKNKEELLWIRLQWLKGRLASLCWSPSVFPRLQRTTTPCPPRLLFLQEGVFPPPHKNKHWGGGTSAVLQRLERDRMGQCSLLLPLGVLGWAGRQQGGGRKGLGAGNPRVPLHLWVWFSCAVIES